MRNTTLSDMRDHAKAAVLDTRGSFKGGGQPLPEGDGVASNKHCYPESRKWDAKAACRHRRRKKGKLGKPETP